MPREERSVWEGSSVLLWNSGHVLEPDRAGRGVVKQGMYLTAVDLKTSNLMSCETWLNNSCQRGRVIRKGEENEGRKRRR